MMRQNKVSKYKFAILSLSALTLSVSLVFYIYRLNWPGIVAALLLTIVFLYIYTKRFKASILTSADKAEDENHQDRLKSLIHILIFSVLYIACLMLLIFSRTSDSIISPWQKVPLAFFILYFLLTTNLCYMLVKEEMRKTGHILAFPFLFLTFSICAIVYRIGYGYDPFIHRASVGFISEHGYIIPKTIYYLGQYSLFAIIHKISAVPIDWLDKFFVQFISSILLLPIIINNFKYRHPKFRYLTTILLLILGFSMFIVTVPQNIAYLLFAVLVFESLDYKKEAFPYLFVLSLAISAFQPIAGIPAVIYVFFRHFQNDPKMRYSLLMLTVFLLPLVFLAISAKIDLDWHLADLSLIRAYTGSGLPNKEGIWLDLVYFLGKNKAILIALLLTGGFLLRRKSKKYRYDHLTHFSFALFCTYLLLSFISFDYLIEYERSGFADRLLILAVLTACPLILAAIEYLIRKVMLQNRTVKFGWLILVSSLLTASLYLSYPRFDHYFNSRGYSTGRVDIEAVNHIDADTADDYIVLANQQVSAAALHQFGFKKYYKLSGQEREAVLDNGQIFYYPIPTGGPLYQYYLKMVEGAPQKEYIKKAMELAGVKTGYFVLNKYWWAFPKILEEAKISADSYKEFGDGEVYVFKYIY